ncbi:MAG: hypothetical protein QOF56_2844, partial [Acidobacteriaceae bacterium]|nr:hypothetical protein [Acidobacteriaceae bacterium]
DLDVMSALASYLSYQRSGLATAE